MSLRPPRLGLKKHALTAISYLLPVVVASGLLIAIGNLAGGKVITDYSRPYDWQSALVSLGVLGMGMLPAVISAAIAFSIADRPGIAPGLLVGAIAGTIGAGFLGGMLGGFCVGWFLLWLRRVIKVPTWAEGLMPMMILPLLASLVTGLLMFFVIGVPIVWATERMTDFLTAMQGSMRFVFGAVLGAMAAFDFGGPVNKTASLFADGLLLEGVLQPEAVKILASMVPPFGVGLSWALSVVLRRPIWGRREKDNIKVALPMGACMITEGVIPVAATDLMRMVVACSSGAAVGGGFSMLWNIGSPVPSGGLFIVPAMNHPLLFLLALVIGSCVTALILFLWKPRVTESAESAETAESKEGADAAGTDGADGAAGADAAPGARTTPTAATRSSSPGAPPSAGSTDVSKEKDVDPSQITFV
ncbi:PTS fructose transporter subunit IIC [Streptomyces sp. NPDC004111]|uniref:PTS fructose transporter subunit IIC n=1 Tax=Streptomyces sp. NPDC004111 TaxID=3364690 RepID=UPI0036966558